MWATFAGMALYDAVQERKGFLPNQPIHPDALKANSFACPGGVAPGKGYILMLRRDLNQLGTARLNVVQPLIFADDFGTKLQFNGMVFVGARNISPGQANDPAAVYLVEIADCRWLVHNPFFSIPVETQYNVPAPGYGTGAYYLDTMILLSEQTGTLTSTSKIITSLTATSMLSAGMVCDGDGVLPGTKIASVDSSTQITLAYAATASGSNSLSFYTPVTWATMAKDLWNRTAINLVSTQNGTLAVASASVTGLTDTSMLTAGMVVEGDGVLGGATIVSVTSPTAVTLSLVASEAGAKSLSFYSSPIGPFPGLPVTPDSPPTAWKFPGVSTWLALNRVLYRIGCMVAADLTQPVGSQFSIVQIGATDQAVEDAITKMDSGTRKIWDEEFVEGVAGRAPFGVRVFFHRQQQHFGTEETTPIGADQFITNAVYSVDIDGPDTFTQSGIYAPIWDDLPALYDATGTLTNSSALDARAAERSDDFYRMLDAGGTRLHKTYSGIVNFAPGSTLKGVCWKQWGSSGGWATEIMRHPWRFLRTDEGEWREDDMGSVAIQPPDLAPTYPNYPPSLHEINLNSGTPTVYYAATAAIAAGGSGYSVNDVLTLSGGSSTTAATFKVTTVSSGAVTAVTVVNPGSYTTKPSNPVSVTGGGGSSCTLTVAWEGQFDAWVERRDPATPAWADREKCWGVEINGKTTVGVQRYSARGPVGCRDGRPTYLFLAAKGGDTWIQVSSTSVSSSLQAGNVYALTGKTFGSAGESIKVFQVNGYVLNTGKYFAAVLTGMDSASGLPIYSTSDQTGFDGSQVTCDAGVEKTWTLENGIVKTIA